MDKKIKQLIPAVEGTTVSFIKGTYILCTFLVIAWGLKSDGTGALPMVVDEDEAELVPAQDVFNDEYDRMSVD